MTVTLAFYEALSENAGRVASSKVQISGNTPLVAGFYMYMSILADEIHESYLV